jgi:hypothetical protein
MISSEVQRTLVKSPPELWAEISDPEALARHLGEFGEIRITRVQPEQKVEWEAPEASGSIVIKPSGWGTKVKLTVTRELSEAETGAEPDQTSVPGEGVATEQTHEPSGTAEPETEAEFEPHDELEPATEDESLAEHDSLLASADEDAPQPEQEPEPAPERRLGFFARLFGRRHATRKTTGELDLDTLEIADDPSDEPPALDEADASDEAPILAEDAGIDAEAELDVEMELDAELDAEVLPPTPPTPTPAATNRSTQAATEAGEAADRLQPAGAVEQDHSPTDAQANIAAELEQAEEAATEQVTAVLTGVLDRLGAAHHRPFSRA